jgi:hypothetical protein
LSLGRNNLRKIEKLEDLAGSLEQLWLSYNGVEKLDGLSALRHLTVLFISNNKIKNFDELLKLKDLPKVRARARGLRDTFVWRQASRPRLASLNSPLSFCRFFLPLCHASAASPF